MMACGQDEGVHGGCANRCVSGHFPAFSRASEGFEQGFAEVYMDFMHNFEDLTGGLALQEILDDVNSNFVPAHVNIFYCFGGLVLTSCLSAVANIKAIVEHACIFTAFLSALQLLGTLGVILFAIFFRDPPRISNFRLVDNGTASPHAPN